MQKLFLDSGAYTLYSRSIAYAKENDCERWDFYNTQEFWDYIDRYAGFVSQWDKELDLYANMDAIGNAEISWRNQQYLEEEWGLTPMPVVHQGTSLDWISHYLKRGYPIIALGGLVGAKRTVSSMRSWLDRCFELVCDPKTRLPKVKVHGFGLTSYSLLLRYPWYSVDSTTWIKRGNFGELLVPKKRNGRFIYTQVPYTIPVSTKHSVHGTSNTRHHSNMTASQRAILQEWLDLICIPLGESKGDEVIVEGVTNNAYQRWAANLLFFERMLKEFPSYPQPWKVKRSHRPKLGLT